MDLVHVPYKGNALALNGLLGGQVQLLFVELASVAPHIKAGKLKALAVVHSKRSSLLPDTPLVTDVLPGFAARTWWGIVAPPKTPPAIIRKLQVSVADVLRQPARRNGRDDEAGARALVRSHQVAQTGCRLKEYLHAADHAPLAQS